jgi:hypothetical protein
VGTTALYKVHTASVASGPRFSEQLRKQAVAAAKGEAPRTTDVLGLIANESARAAIAADPHAAPVVELLLSWMYGLAADFALPSLGSGPVVNVVRQPANPPTRASALPRMLARFHFLAHAERHLRPRPACTDAAGSRRCSRCGQGRRQR